MNLEDKYHIRLDDQLKEQLPSADITVDENIKIITSLSVAQLAYIFRVFTETGTLQTGNLSNLFRFVAEHISTARQEKSARARNIGHFGAAYLSTETKLTKNLKLA